MLFSLPAESQISDKEAVPVTEFTPIPKRKKEVIKQYNTTPIKKIDNIPQLRQIIEVQEKNII
ncbi:MAG: hypothetical protein PV340_02335, partial [Wolbachia sp.]|nr:hypothetical protein [Wolbachia sp.]